MFPLEHGFDEEEEEEAKWEQAQWVDEDDECREEVGFGELLNAATREVDDEADDDEWAEALADAKTSASRLDIGIDVQGPDIETAGNSAEESH